VTVVTLSLKFTFSSGWSWVLRLMVVYYDAVVEHKQDH
jgi:hypothetical protein